MTWLSGWAVGLGLDVLVLLGLVSAVRSLPKARATLRQEIRQEVGEQLEPLVLEIKALTVAVRADAVPVPVDQDRTPIYVVGDTETRRN